MSDNEWSIGRARRQFSDLIRSAAREPQALYNRGRVVAAVIDADELREFEAWKRQRDRSSIADAFDALQSICADDDYALPIAPRADRANPFDGDGVPR